MTLNMLIGLFRGLGLLIYGMHMMREGLKTLAQGVLGLKIHKGLISHEVYEKEMKEPRNEIN